jgi:hypothetical protein
MTETFTPSFEYSCCSILEERERERERDRETERQRVTKRERESERVTDAQENVIVEMVLELFVAIIDQKLFETRGDASERARQ